MLYSVGRACRVGSAYAVTETTTVTAFTTLTTLTPLYGQWKMYNATMIDNGEQGALASCSPGSWTGLKAGETVYQTGEPPQTLYNALRSA